MGVCKLCGEDKQLVKSHIIPRSFYMQFRKIDNRGIHIASTEADKPPKRSQTGIYERIVCRDCEDLFSPWDDYAIELLLTEVQDYQKIYYKDKCIGYRINEYNYHYLKLFFLSVLWRMSVSKHEFFQKINLESDEKTIGEMIKHKDAGNPCSNPIFILSFTDPLRTFLVNPSLLKFEGYDYYVLYFAGYKIFIKKEKGIPLWLDEYILKPKLPLLVIYQDLFSSKEYKSFDETSRRLYSE